MIKSVANTHNCFGCGVCSLVCKKNLIDLELNEDGFFEPKVDITECTNCGLCKQICTFKYIGETFPILKSSYGAWSKDNNVLESCSSGGIAYEISKTAITEGYKICAVKYNTAVGRAEHYISENIDQLEESKGSKYLQSYTIEALKNINLNHKYLIFGTPCQISSFRKALKLLNKEENFILIDFFCHGVPSKFIWDKYISSLSKNLGTIKSVKWRNKIDGWHNSWILTIKGDKNEYISFRSKGDKFYNIFLSDSCLNKACYFNCKFKAKHSHADIRLGDAWGEYYKNNDYGVSIVYAYSKKGESLLSKSNIILDPLNPEILSEYQMMECPKQPPIYNRVRNLIKKKNSTIKQINNIIENEKKKRKLKYRINKFISFFTK